jgi:hypothetical protein
MNKTINKSIKNENKEIIIEKRKQNKPKKNDVVQSNNNKSNNNVSNNNITNPEIDLNEVFKFFGEIFNNSNKNGMTNTTNTTNTTNINDRVIHIRKECIMDIFEYQIKQQLKEIAENGLLKKIDEHMDLTYDETVKKMDNILLSIEKDPGFINLTLEELYVELENIPSQEDYDCFCEQMSYEKKLDKTNSSNREKLFTIMYTIGNNCIGSNINLKKIILSIIKYELTRNELVEIIKKYNKEHNELNTLDFITADMMFMSLGKFLSHSNMKIISRNIAYYFSKIC